MWYDAPKSARVSSLEGSISNPKRRLFLGYCGSHTQSLVVEKPTLRGGSSCMPGFANSTAAFLDC